MGGGRGEGTGVEKEEASVIFLQLKSCVAVRACVPLFPSQVLASLGRVRIKRTALPAALVIVVLHPTPHLSAGRRRLP